MMPIKTKTDKYNHMISAFQCDFTLARDGVIKLTDLQKNLDIKDERFIKDIKLLEELEFKLRRGIAEIHEEVKE